MCFFFCLLRGILDELQAPTGGAYTACHNPSSAHPAAAAPVQAQAAPQDQYNNNNCGGAAQSFTKCLDDNGGNMQICNWYLEQLKACQAAANH
ncbi:hypothetical protein G7Z17_g5787 [Cylindrodendrum hubeiense]|uniref:CHCH domain-containing protein n=1 Tax=Cylindrodendrum hubeiense TaxID=595255 RepID=A0A9P5HCB8_9HYPO|nr:hypothetical protein G7Z17_g5787 [Cylindrodendrum hubeiense]